MIIDKALVDIIAGNGGNGAIAFRRERGVDKGGPSGGDGGRGGSVIFKASHNINTLIDFKFKKKIQANNGENGMGKKCYGRKGDDVIVLVPIGTMIYNDENDLVVADLSHDNDEIIVCKGGRGGRGNCHFTSSRFQVPEIAENGELGEKMKVRLELKLLADVGLVGYPSVGKSTLISIMSDAKPDIADYHFTTLSPVLGLVRVSEGKSFVMADLPGLIDGASEGKGLGFEFLRHIERCRVIVHVIDMGAVEGRNPYEDYINIKHELELYNPDLLKRPSIIVANKMDEEDAIKNLKAFKKKLKEDVPIFEISCLTHDHLDELKYYLSDLLDKTPLFPMYSSLDDYKVYLNEEEEFCKVRVEKGVYVVYGGPVEACYYRSNFQTDAGVLKFIRILRYNGVEERLKEAGIQDGDTVKVVDFEFDYFD